MQEMNLNSPEAWYKAIAAMVREGVTFTASNFGGNYTITFTGGY